MTKQFDIEIDKKAHSKLTKAQVREKLCLMNWKSLIDRLDLDSDLVRDHKVHPIATIKMDALVVDGKRNFGAKPYPSDRQLPA